MAYQININELLELGAEIIPANEFNGYKTTAEQLAHNLAMRIAKLADNAEYLGKSTLEPGFAGLCSPFIPADDTKPIDCRISSIDPKGWPE